MVYAGLDIGTTGAKITLYEDERELGKFYESYHSSRNAFHDEIEATLILDAVKKLILEAYSFRHDLHYIGVTSFGETFVLLDQNDHILAPSILYNDVRGKEETEIIKKKVSASRIGEITGLMVHEMFSLPKLLSIKLNHPDLYSKVSKVLLIQDYVIYMLTGISQIDYSLASRTMLFDIHKHAWSEELFAAFDLDESMFSKPVKTGTIAGPIKAIEGIEQDIVLLNVSHDQVSVAIGSGLREVGDAVDGCGTCECLIPYLNKVPTNPLIYEDGFGVVPYLDEGSYVTYPLIFSGGALVKWFMDNFAKGNDDPYRYYEENMTDFLPSSLLIAPHFLGSGTPFMNSRSKSFIYGLDISTSLNDLYKGVLEGVAYEMRVNLEELAKCDVKIKRIFANGGGSQNEKWLQIKADILNIPVTKILNHDAGTVGSAIVTGTAIGVFSSYEEGISKLVKTGQTFYPNEKIHELYEPLFARYKELVQEKEGR